MDLVPDEADLKSTFYNNVLLLEISCLKEDHLSVVDVPGIFERTTSRVTSKQI